MDSLEGQTFLVTGASKGLGKSLSVELAQKGARVLLLARQSTDLEETASIVQQISPSSLSVVCDLADSGSITAAAQTILEKVTQVDGLVHNAGDISPIKPLFAADLDAWTRSMMVNVIGVQALTSALSAVLLGGHRVRVTTISSGAALRPLPSWSAYCSAKAALDMWTRCLAAEGAEHNMSAVSVAPGIVDTAMQATIRAASTEDFPLRENFVGYHEDGQLAHPDEVAQQLMPLVTEHTMHESGQRFDVREL